MNFSIPDTTISITDLTNYIQDLLEEDWQLQQVWVTCGADDRYLNAGRESSFSGVLLTAY